MPTTQEMVLLYYPGQEAAKAKCVFLQQRIRIKAVEPEQMGQTVGALVGLASGGAADGGPVEIPSGPVMVFSGLSSQRLDRVLSALRRAGVPKQVFKAVVTTENLGWSFSALCAELARERAAVEQGK